MNRRRFLEGAGAFTASMFGASLTNPSQAEPPAAAPRSADEAEFWKQIRSEFPLGDHRIYLNTGGLGASPRVAIDAVKDEMDKLERIAETGRSASLWVSIKSTAGSLLGCPARNIAYTRNATEGINIVCNGLPLAAGDEVITSAHEHVANTVTWLARQRFDGIRLRVFEPSLRSAQENLDRIERLITPRTRVLSLPHVTTTTGQVMPVEDIGALARYHGLWYFLDGAQAPGMMPVDVGRIGCHAYATSGHKWLLGPKGTGLVYVHDEALETIRPRWVGAHSAGGQPDMIYTGEFHFDEGAQRYEFGTVSVPLFIGLGASMRFLSDGGIHLTGVTICSVHGVSSRWQALPGLGWRVSSLVSNRCGLPGLPRMAAVARRLRLSELRPRRRLALGRWPLHVSGVFDTQFGDGRYDLRSDADTLDDMVHRLLAVRHR